MVVPCRPTSWVVVRARFWTGLVRRSSSSTADGNHRRVVRQPAALVGSLVQQDRRPAEQAGRGVVAAGHHGEGKPQDPHDRDGVLTHGHQLADHVVFRFDAATFDEVGEVGQQVHDARRRVVCAALGGSGHDLLGPLVEVEAVLGGDAKVVGHHEAGERLEQLGHDVAATVLVDPFEAVDDEGSDVALDVGNLAGREARADQPPERRVVRRVEEDERGRLPHVHARAFFDGEASG
ncbi:MAG: hypothetical protein CM1200mP26_15240 [Acidimicrobiales bacterium]|nr:MAG: hypothetical protein CM1200mP26_15240 [Acidimicrobiales bacterium]